MSYARNAAIIPAPPRWLNRNLTGPALPPASRWLNTKNLRLFSKPSAVSADEQESMANVIHSQPHLLNEDASVRRPRAWWQRIRVQWHDSVSFLVPVGYQDQQGFHYGPSPASPPPEQLADLIDQN